MLDQVAGWQISSEILALELLSNLLVLFGVLAFKGVYNGYLLSFLVALSLGIDNNFLLFLRACIFDAFANHFVHKKHLEV